MSFHKHAPKFVMALLMTSFVACDQQNNAFSEKGEQTDKSSKTKWSDTSKNQQLISSKLAEEYASKGKISEAISLLNQELQKSSDSLTFLYKLGNLHLLAGDTTKALNLMQQSIEKGYRDPDAIVKTGFLYANKNDGTCLRYAELLIHDDQASKTNYLGYFLKGIYYANIGNRKEALISFDKSIVDNYRFIDSYIEKAILLYESKEYKKSILLLEKGIEIDKYQADLYYWIGRNSEKLKDIDNCIYAYEQTLALAPDFENAKIKLDSLNKIKNK